MAEINPIISQEILLEATGYERLGDLEKWLRREGVRYYRGRGNRIFTTIDALNAPLEDSDASDIEFE